MTPADFRPQYEATRYLVHHAGATIDARIGTPNAALDALLAAEHAASGIFITAANPRSKKRRPEENATANRALAAALQPWKTLPHEGRAVDGSWAEPGFFAVGVPRETALALAERFGQNAIVWCALGRAPALLFTREVEDAGQD
jgi:hypothetical protein